MSWHLCTGKSSSNNYDVVDGRLIPRCHHADLLRPRLDLVLCHSNKVELHSPSSTSKPVTKVTRSRVKNTEWNRTDATYTKVNTVRTQFWNWGRESRLREQNSHLSKLRHFPFRKNNKPFHCLSFLIVPVKKNVKKPFLATKSIRNACAPFLCGLWHLWYLKQSPSSHFLSKSFFK